jgi:hypothetical protein
VREHAAQDELREAAVQARAATAPAIAAAAKPEASVTSIPPLARCAARAAPLVSEITSSDVPTASAIGNARPSVSAGTITKPPPTPKKPVSRPVSAPAAATRGRTRRCASTLPAAGRGARAMP